MELRSVLFIYFGYLLRPKAAHNTTSQLRRQKKKTQKKYKTNHTADEIAVHA